MGANPYTYAPQYFDAEHGVTGRYWKGNKQYPGKAYINEIEYTDIIVLEKEKAHTKAARKLKKNKEYLGFYIDPTNNQEYQLYGVKKYPDLVDDEPDSDVLTEIAIKIDYGMEE